MIKWVLTVLRSLSLPTMTASSANGSCRLFTRPRLEDLSWLVIILTFVLLQRSERILLGTTINGV